MELVDPEEENKTVTTMIFQDLVILTILRLMVTESSTLEMTYLKTLATLMELKTEDTKEIPIEMTLDLALLSKTQKMCSGNSLDLMILLLICSRLILLRTFLIHFVVMEDLALRDLVIPTLLA